ncbi:MAG: hypothetical protein V7K88_33000 [Nostoc sp.]|uniref:hypothetical protein n=1 Tax=Nostoc sp. TaxID=1180 RepID=UPI002FF5F6C8
MTQELIDLRTCIQEGRYADALVIVDELAGMSKQAILRNMQAYFRGCLKSPQACVLLPWLPRNCYERIGVLGFEIAPLSRT